MRQAIDKKKTKKNLIKTVQIFCSLIIFNFAPFSISAQASSKINNLNTSTEINNTISKEVNNLSPTEIVDKINKTESNPLPAQPFQKIDDTYISKQGELEITLTKDELKIKNFLKGNYKVKLPLDTSHTELHQTQKFLVNTGKNTKYDVVIKAIDGGVQNYIVIKDSSAPTEYVFDYSIRKGDKLEKQSNGGVILKDSKNKSIATIAPPWAKDANAQSLPTEYKIVGTKLIQNVKTENAVFPVVADPEICSRYISTVNWRYKQIYANLGLDWSLEVIPTYCGRLKSYLNLWQSWEELYARTFRCAQFSGNRCITVPWDKQWNTSKYWSMYNQYACHVHFAGLYKKDYNLEPSRPDYGYNGFVARKCND
jgi:Protein of unknown function (DUF2599)